MNRHAKRLQRKAKKCTVKPVPENDAVIVHSPSGNRYLVRAAAGGGWFCSCDWSQWHNTNARPCAHVLAADAWETRILQGRTTSYWPDEESARRQHRPWRRIGIGLWKTTRKAA